MSFLGAVFSLKVYNGEINATVVDTLGLRVSIRPVRDFSMLNVSNAVNLLLFFS
jgi:hypothetical protein